MVSKEAEIVDAGVGGWDCWEGWSSRVGDFTGPSSLELCARDMGGSPEAWRAAERMNENGYGFVAYLPETGWAAGSEPANGPTVHWGNSDTLAGLLEIVGLDPAVEREAKYRARLERSGQGRLFR